MCVSVLRAVHCVCFGDRLFRDCQAFTGVLLFSQFGGKDIRHDIVCGVIVASSWSYVAGCGDIVGECDCSLVVACDSL
jgi:hypothetical protein